MAVRLHEVKRSKVLMPHALRNSYFNLKLVLVFIDNSTASLYNEYKTT